jgi:hypothetical protein
MQRLFVPAVILWLAAFGAAQAQTQAQNGPTVTSTPDSTTTNGATTFNGTPASTSPKSVAPATGTAASQAVPATGLGQPCPTPGLPTGVTSVGCGSDPLSVPTSTVRTTFPVPQSGSVSSESPSEATIGRNASASVNPQRATQLPGEGSNASTQAPNTTAASAAAVSGSVPCTSSVPTTQGGASMNGVFGGGAASGC